MIDVFTEIKLFRSRVILLTTFFLIVGLVARHKDFSCACVS